MPEVALADLWLPILLSAVAVFIASSVIHMATPMHKKDYAQLPNQDAVMEAMRNAGVQRGAYVFPYASSMKEMGDEAFIAKQNAGPVGFMQVLPNGPMQMGSQLVAWFVYSVLISVFEGYIATLIVGKGGDYHVVFRVTGTVAILGYALSGVQESIWKGVSWAVTFRFFIDGVIYGLLTAGVFGAMWPAAS